MQLLAQCNWEMKSEDLHQGMWQILCFSNETKLLKLQFVGGLSFMLSNREGNIEEVLIFTSLMTKLEKRWWWKKDGKNNKNIVEACYSKGNNLASQIKSSLFLAWSYKINIFKAAESSKANLPSGNFLLLSHFLSHELPFDSIQNREYT